MNEKLLDDDVKIIRRQIEEGVPYGEVINFMVNHAWINAPGSAGRLRASGM